MTGECRDTSHAAYLDWCAQEANGETPPMSYEAWFLRRMIAAEKACDPSEIEVRHEGGDRYKVRRVVQLCAGES